MRITAIASMTLLACMPDSFAAADVDTSDVDTFLMQDMKHALQDLEPALTAGNTTAALADAEVLRDGMQWTYDYFAAKENTPDAVQISADGRDLVARISSAIESKDLDAAIAAARDVGKNCKACHQIYRNKD